MTVAERGSEPFTPEVSNATKRKVSPLRGLVASTGWLQVPHRTPLSSASSSSLTDSPSRQSSEVFASKLTTFAVVRCGVSGPATVPTRYPATRHSAPPATKTGVGRVTFPTGRAWHAGWRETCSDPGGHRGRTKRGSARMQPDDVCHLGRRRPEVFDGDPVIGPPTEYDPVARCRHTATIARNPAEHRTAVAGSDLTAIGEH